MYLQTKLKGWAINDIILGVGEGDEHLNRRDDVDNPSDALSFFAKFASVFPRMLSFGGKMLDFPIILTFS